MSSSVVCEGGHHVTHYCEDCKNNVVHKGPVRCLNKGCTKQNLAKINGGMRYCYDGLCKACKGKPGAGNEVMKFSTNIGVWVGN